MEKNNEEYLGELPKHVVAQIQEHTAGGFILFRIGSEGEIINDMMFDSELYYLALVKKATSTLLALNSIDNNQAIRSLSNSFDEGGFEEEYDEEEEEEDEEEYDDNKEEDDDDDEDAKR